MTKKLEHCSFHHIYRYVIFISTFMLLACMPTGVRADAVDAYDRVMERGVLRHVAVPYAHFVTGSGDGLDVELIQLFAKYLGVRYEYIQTNWHDAIKVDLFPNEANHASTEASQAGEDNYGGGDGSKGDMVANGLTILPWRKKVITYSVPTFPSGVWLVARADSDIEPIIPTGSIESDIANTVDRAKGHSVLAIKGGCLDPGLSRLDGSGADVKLMPVGTNLNDLVPLVISGKADGTLIDVPDGLIALQKWPGKIKIIGPMTPEQQMGAAFSKTSVKLRDVFNTFFLQTVREGKYQQLVKKYYPSIFEHFPAFFTAQEAMANKTQN